MESQDVDINKIKKAYFVGIKGVGMTALAQVLRARGIKVSGSDTHEKFFTDEVLEKLKIPLHEGFRKSNIPKNTDLVITSTAYFNVTRQSRVTLNIEIQETLKRKIPILTYPEALGLLFQESYGIAVAGTHGKTTVTAMLGVILEEAGLDPTVIVGTRVNQWGSNARASTRGIKSPNRGGRDRAPLLVAEADEYQEAFLNYEPKGLIVTSIEYDHPDYFKTFGTYKNAFRKLVRKVPKDGFIVANWDDENIREVTTSARCRIVKYKMNQQKSFKLKLLVPGEFNILNALAAATLVHELGVGLPIIKKALANFQGTARRFEILQDTNPIIIDDYAHHPTEVQATLKAVRGRWPKKEIWVVFQPHTFSRTEALLKDFSSSFNDADRVFILKTYSSAREVRGKVGAKELAKGTAKHHKRVQYVSSIPEAVKVIKNELNSKQVLITMGAGNVWEVANVLGRHFWRVS